MFPLRTALPFDPVEKIKEKIPVWTAHTLPEERYHFPSKKVVVAMTMTGEGA